MSPAFLEELARPRPDPGGGAAAAHAAALGLALLTKVVRLEARRPGGPDSFWEEMAIKAGSLRQSLQRLQEEDVRSYARLSRARAGGGDAALAAAVREAVAAPRAIMEEAQEAMRLILEAGVRCQAHLVSDLLVAGELLAAALAGAHHIAGANLALVQDAPARRQLSQELEHELREGNRLAAQVRDALQARGPGNFPPTGLK